MSKIPFKRFIITFLLFNKDIEFILAKLRQFQYDIKSSEVSAVFEEIKSILPEKYKQMLENGQLFDINDEYQVQWLKKFGVFEYYDFIIKQRSLPEDRPEYFKWCEDCMWVHAYSDVMSIVNILMFNGEPFDSISKIIFFKFKKKIGVDALELYKRMFWDIDALTAKEAIYFCVPFRNNTMIIRNIRGGAEVETSFNSTSSEDASHDGSDVPFTFHDNNYIKWKLGYREIPVPTSQNFLEQVQRDSYFKYYEAMNMTQSIETEDESGENEKLGEFSSRKVKRRNVEENRVKIAKHWVDLYLKANSSMPVSSDDDFFDRMDQLEMEFDDLSEEKLAKIDDMKEVLDDIKGDMN